MKTLAILLALCSALVGSASGESSAERLLEEGKTTVQVSQVFDHPLIERISDGGRMALESFCFWIPTSSQTDISDLIDGKNLQKVGKTQKDMVSRKDPIAAFIILRDDEPAYALVLFPDPDHFELYPITIVIDNLYVYKKGKERVFVYPELFEAIRKRVLSETP